MEGQLFSLQRAIRPLSFVFCRLSSPVSRLASSRVSRLLSRALPLSAALSLFVFALAAPAIAAPSAPLTTPWGEKVTDANAWREYPRPQLVRDGWTNLNGAWDYAVTSVTNTPGRPEKWDGRIRVPFAIESALSGVGRLLGPDEFL